MKIFELQNHIKISIFFNSDQRNEFSGVDLTEFRQPLQVQSHLEMSGILVQLGHIQRT